MGVRKLTTPEFITQARLVHGDKYDYSKVIYTTDRVDITITCHTHGDFEQRPAHHKRGSGCSKCADVNTGNRTRLTTEGFILRATAVHGNKYDYSKVNYNNTHTKVTISCRIHGEFHMNLNNHVSGKQGCQECGRRNTSASLALSEPTILYYIKFNTIYGPLYKIGITLARRGVKSRFSGALVPQYTVLKETIYTTGIQALREEQRLHQEFRHFRYSGTKVLPSGNTELYTQDVLALSDAMSITG